MGKVGRNILRAFLAIVLVALVVPVYGSLVPTTFGFPTIVQNGSTSAFNQDTVQARDLENIIIDFPLFDPGLDIGPTPAESTTVSFTTPGTFTFTVPDKVTSVDVTVIGGGGGGGGGAAAGMALRGGGGGGGGSGFVTTQSSIAVTPGELITIIVGDGGNGGTPGIRSGTRNGGSGTNGGPSSFNGITANGGGAGGGGIGSSPFTGGAGGPGFNAGANGVNGGVIPGPGGAGGTGFTVNGVPYGDGGAGGSGGGTSGVGGNSGDPGAVFIMYAPSPALEHPSANALPFDPSNGVDLAFPSISQDVRQAQTVTHTDFAQTNELAESAYPFEGVG